MSPSLASLDSIMNDLSCRGWSVAAHFLPQDIIDRLAGETLQAMQDNKLQPGNGGRAAERSADTGIREDFILWMEEPDLTAAQRCYLERLKQLRLAANSALHLDLSEFEGHLAVYPPGAFYHKHIDRFQTGSQRVLTCILYLNADWDEADGGQLRLYLDDERYFDILPQAGTLVAFLSDRFWHEVLPMNRDRMSITGWFKSHGPAAA